MRLVTCRYHDTVYLGVLKDTAVMLPALSTDWNNRFPDMLALIDAGQDGCRQLAEFIAHCEDEIRVEFGQVRLLAPIPKPRENIICLGWNYKDHITETEGQAVSNPLPKAPIVFTKHAACVCGPTDDIPYNADISAKMDWEAELGVVIGRNGCQIAVADALDYVFGYTVINDITARDLQKRHRQFYLGKSLPAGCPTGPCLVTADEIADPQNLTVKSWVNGELKQSASTAEQIFDIASVIATLSKTPGIQSGNMIATGTPSGVGYVRRPPEYLRPGDVVECEVESIGRLCNRIVSPGCDYQ